MAERFYSEKPVSVGQVVALDDLQSHHLLHVMRAAVGDQVQVFDGSPQAFTAQVAAKDRRTVRLEILAPVPVASSWDIPAVLVAAPVPKGDRFRFLIEKLTEMGTVAYQPLLTQRSVNPLTPGVAKKAEQWVIEACKQSGRNGLLQIRPAAQLVDVMSACRSLSERIVACTPDDHQRAVDAANSRPTAAEACQPPASSAGGCGVDSGAGAASLPRLDTAIVVGPEGGLTAGELGSLVGEGWRPLQIGPHVLRIETAAVAILAWCLGRHAKADRVTGRS
jgi:16S rRNA (uracil1498-N3)-methyltransferase